MNWFARGPLAAVVLLAATAAVAPAQDPKADLTGVWTGDTGGVYYVRQDGDSVWWLGMSDDGGKAWTHVFRGKLGKSEVVGEWADVPKGTGGLASGSLTLGLQVKNGKVVGFAKVGQKGGEFGNNAWSRKP